MRGQLSVKYSRLHLVNYWSTAACQGIFLFSNQCASLAWSSWAWWQPLATRWWGGAVCLGRIGIGLTHSIDQLVQLPRLAALFCNPGPALHLSRLQSGQLFARSGSQTYCILLLRLGLGPMVQVSVWGSSLKWSTWGRFRSKNWRY